MIDLAEAGQGLSRDRSEEPVGAREEVRVKVQAWVLLLGLSVAACASNADLGGGSGDSGTLADSSVRGGPDGSNGGDDGSSDGEVGDAGDGASNLDFQDAAPIPLADLCPLFTEDLCTYLIQCDKAPYRDMSQCLAENYCYGLPELTQAAAQGAVIYDPSKVGACDARFRSDPCGFADLLFATDIFYVLSFCPGTLTPEQKQGDACVSDGECQSGLFCNKGDTGACPGTCTAYSTAGQPCDTNGLQCADGFLCNASNICEATTGAVGTPCTSDSDCGGSTIYICLGDAACNEPPVLWCDKSTGTCAAGLDAGAACGPADAGNQPCARGLSCAAVLLTGTCVAPGPAGTPCSDDSACETGLHCGAFQFDVSLGKCAPPTVEGAACTSQTECASGLFCKYDEGGTSAVCSAPSGLGGACTGNSNADCQTGLTCSNQICMNTLYPGDACGDATSLCVLSTCKSGVCANYAKVGGACATTSDCFEGACVAGTCADTTVCANPGDGGA